MRAAAAILTFFVVSLVSFSQNTISCLTESQLLNLQSLSYTGAGSYLSNEGWSRNEEYANQTRRYFGYNLDYSVAVWQKRSTNYIESKLYIYYRNGKPNLLIYQAINECFENSRNGQPQNRLRRTQRTDHISFYIMRENGVVMDFRDYSNDNSLARFSVLIFNEESVNEQVETEKARLEAIAQARADSIESLRAREEALRMAELERQNTLTSALNQADGFYKEGDFAEAVTFYETAKKYMREDDKSILQRISLQIQSCRENLNRIRIENAITEGNRYFDLKDFNSALNRYDQALALFNDTPSNFDTGSNIENQIKKKIGDTKNVLDILTLRRTPQLYSKVDPENFRNFRDDNLRVINSMIYNFSKSGNISFKSVIDIDTLGTNRSHKEIISSSGNRISTYLDRINYSQLTPVKVLDLIIPVNEELPFRISWNSFPLSARARKSKVRMSAGADRISNSTSNIESFIKRQEFSNGIYRFDVIDKTINDTRLQDITLTSYKNNSGPIKSINSLFLPGLGSLRVTNGEKGAGKMKLYLLSAIISVGSKIYSDIEYKRFTDDNSGQDANEHYDLANRANKVFLISGGIAATLYIHDFFWVIGKGIKNNNLNKELKNRLKSGPVKVIESPFNNL